MLDQARDEVSPDFLRLTQELTEFAASKGARVLFVFPAISEAKWDAEVGARMAQFMRQNLDIPIVNNPADYVMANELFFDTKYHTTAEGRQIRTVRTIRDLRSHF